MTTTTGRIGTPIKARAWPPEQEDHHAQHSKPQSGTTASAANSQGSTATSGPGKTIDGYQVIKTIDLTATAYGPTDA